MNCPHCHAPNLTRTNGLLHCFICTRTFTPTPEKPRPIVHEWPDAVAEDLMYRRDNGRDRLGRRKGRHEPRMTRGPRPKAEPRPMIQ